MACLTEAGPNNLIPVLDVIELASSQQETFQKLQELALTQVQECGSEDNPELFDRLEDILQPLYLSWKRKYDQVKELMKKESLGQSQAANSFIRSSCRNSLSQFPVTRRLE